MDPILFLAPSFIIALLLTGIHCYLGLHVLTRKIIFIDLALAQAGAFGLAISLLLGWGPYSLISYIAALVSALSSSLLFTMAAAYKKQLSQEAFIGIVYAFFSVLVILLFDKFTHGAEHIKHTLTGHLIWAGWGEALKVFIIYAGVSLIYFIFHKKLLKNSLNQNSSLKWDLLFYILFSIVIASSVSIAGILLVFSFLIVPAFLSGFFYKSFFHRLLFGWGIGIGISLLGLAGSYFLSLPTSPFLVFLFTFTPILFIISKFLYHMIKKYP